MQSCHDALLQSHKRTQWRFMGSSCASWQNPFESSKRCADKWRTGVASHANLTSHEYLYTRVHAALYEAGNGWGFVTIYDAALWVPEGSCFSKSCRFNFSLLLEVFACAFAFIAILPTIPLAPFIRVNGEIDDSAFLLLSNPLGLLRAPEDQWCSRLQPIWNAMFIIMF